MDTQGRAALGAIHAWQVEATQRRIRNLLTAAAPARVIEMPAANHYVFLSNEAYVLQELRAFLDGLPTH